METRLQKPLRSDRSARSRFTWGIVFLVLGGCLLAANLGVDIPRHLWNYWPALLITLGAIQLAWPGRAHDRLGGYWLLVIGLWGQINMLELFGLYWGNSWPIFIIALGIRVILGGILRGRAAPEITP
ncbi:MAG: hypothetical protein H7Y02_14435 [Candidatus Obscuribacterales bacterium]|nr:hypothetical protein [Steroidobacteraceae bacterium]